MLPIQNWTTTSKTMSSAEIYTVSQYYSYYLANQVLNFPLLCLHIVPTICRSLKAGSVGADSQLNYPHTSQWCTSSGIMLPIQKWPTASKTMSSAEIDIVSQYDCDLDINKI